MGMPRSAVRVEWDVPEPAWAQALAACPDATYFHTAGWLRACERSFGSRPGRLRLTLPDGRWALLALSLRPLARGWLQVGLAGETGAYGGLVAPTPLAAAEVEACYRAVRARVPDLHLTGNPFASGAHLPAGIMGEPGSTHLLQLAPFELLRAGFSRGGKARGNKARKQGFELRRRHDPDAAALFYRLYDDSMRRWGEKLTWPRPLAFFEAVLAESHPHAELFFAYQGERPVSALLMAAYGGKAHYLAGASDAEALAACPSNFLMEEALAHYHAAGLTWFDFGPSNGLAGVTQFKESFGAQAAPYAAHRAQSLRGQLYFTWREAREANARRRPAGAAGLA